MPKQILSFVLVCCVTGVTGDNWLVYIMASQELPFWKEICYIGKPVCNKYLKMQMTAFFLRERDGGIHGLSVLSLQ